MGRSNDALRKANDSIRDFVALVNQEVIDVISEAIPTGTLLSTHTTKRPLNGMNEINVYLCCTGANIVAVDTLTFKFYIREKINGVEKFNEIYQAANYTVLTTGVTADQVRKYSVTDSDSIIKSATHYSVASTAGIAMPALCYATLAVGKAHDIDSAVSIPTIVGNATAAITEVSSTVALTHKSEVRNTGLNTVFLAEGSGGAVAATDFPLYPDETITLKAGTFDAVCGAGLTSTLSILKVS